MTKNQKLTHLDETGRAAMVDVGDKPDTERYAEAEGAVYMQAETLQLIREGNMKKGDVLTVAQIAGIMGAKQTSSLIPLCHPLPITHCEVQFAVEKNRIVITASAKIAAQTGIEMEALTAVSVAALTIYDMCKAIDKKMRIQNIHVISKIKKPL